MLSIKEKIELIINQCEKHDITAYELGENTSISKSSAHKILTKTNSNPKNKTLNIILDYIQSKIVGTNLPTHNIAAKSELIYHKPATHFKKIPFYDLVTTAGNGGYLDAGDFKNITPDSFVELPLNVNADACFPVYGDSMHPIIKSGDIIAIKIINSLEFINYGMKYFILTQEQRMAKYVKKHIKENFVLLESENTFYDTIDMPKDSIKMLGLIVYIGKREM